ncbi:hypothetical protein ACGFZG_13650 [Streptomyces antibioticus]|uniref:hypothetical protein n=1 Tax=Streptomyces antibioticus TaxID=1890 RepID=UPI00371A8322
MTRRGAAARIAVLRSAVVVMVCGASVVALPGSVAVAAPDVPAYAFADDVRRAEPATDTGDAVRLEPGSTYRSSLPHGVGTGSGDGSGDGTESGGKVYYRLELDAASTAYVSVTAIPRPGAALAVGDGIGVAVQNADGTSCSYDSATVGTSQSPRPITAWAAREIQPGRGLCQEAGTYYVVVEPVGTGSSGSGTGSGGSGGDTWDLEIAPVSEPPVAKGASTNVPGTWNSATPAPPTGEAEPVHGGAGFTEAAAVAQGVWDDEIVPGQTLFYRVPVDWGRQLYASVEVGSGRKSSGFVVDALDLTLHNPVRAKVEEVGVGYGGTQKSAALAPAPPVRYANRYAPANPTKSLRFAGDHYLVVHLAAEVAEAFGDGPYGLTLRVRLGGSAQPGPGYQGRAVPNGVFGKDSGIAAPTGAGLGDLKDRTRAASSADGDATMRAVAAAGFGTGTALLLVLGGWTLVGRRRAAASASASAAGQMRVSAQNPTP